MESVTHPLFLIELCKLGPRLISILLLVSNNYIINCYESLIIMIYQ